MSHDRYWPFSARQKPQNSPIWVAVMELEAVFDRFWDCGLFGQWHSDHALLLQRICHSNIATPYLWEKGLSSSGYTAF